MVLPDRLDALTFGAMRHRQPAPDYFAACMVSFGALLFVALVAIWASFGYLAALLAGWLTDALLRRWHAARQASAITAAAASRAPGP